MTIRTKEDLVRDFADNIMAQQAAMEVNDPERGNKHADRAAAAFKALRAMGDEGRDALAVLLKDPRDDVRANAAAFLLRYKNAEATKVLEELASGKPGLRRFAAKQALLRWKEGDWHLDPE